MIKEGEIWKTLKDEEASLTTELNNIPKAQVKDLVLFQRFPASQWIILVAQAAHFMDLMMKFKTSPVMTKIKLIKAKPMLEMKFKTSPEKQAGDEQPV
ncbi:hypothetical protein Tco_0758611 [Tanacetum coccineum]